MLNISKLEYCKLEYQDNWLTLIINNKNKKNALSKKLINEIITILGSLKNDNSIRGVILRGKNNIFCSGADLEELHQIAYNKKNQKELTIEMSKNIGKLLKSIRDTPQITISVIDGPCIAGGFGIACATDIIVTIKDSIFRLSETRLGLTPIQIAPYIFNRLNYSKARLMMLMGDTIGLVNSHIILGLVFIFLVQPIAYIMRLTGYDPLRRRRQGEKTYRENRQTHDTDLTRIF